MSSSLQRTRSLRKPPAPPTGRAPAARAQQPPRPSPPAESDRGDSPSRLPVKPSSTRTASASTTAAARSGARPVSAALHRSASTSQRQHAAAAAREPAKRESSARYPPSAASSRPPARKRPTSAGSATAATATAGVTATATQQKHGPSHSRARSTATALHHNAAPVLRPPSRDVSRAASPPPRPSTVVRASVASTAAKTTPLPSTPTAATASRPPQQPRIRPAFSTLQQHYSPAKSLAPKPLTSTYLVPPSPSKLPVNVAASAETHKLQTELLQLHILHREAAPVQAQWRASARDKLRRRFVDLGEASRALAERQRAGMERDNLLALLRWGNSGKSLDEKMQLLGDILSGLWALSEPGGRYFRTIRRFERWAAGVRDVEEARASPAVDAVSLQSPDELFIDQLDATWEDDCAAMTRRLRDWQFQIQDIDDLKPASTDDGEEDVGSGSSLERMLAAARSLAQDMLAELQAVENVRREALARDEWVESMNQDESEGASHGAVWRTV